MQEHPRTISYCRRPRPPGRRSPFPGQADADLDGQGDACDDDRDSDGDNAKNLDLSQRRAKSVMNDLVKVFGIEASRIETDGMGETKPVAPNDTPVNKALNRRVEFIKL